MNPGIAAVLGLLQGVTEFLPVSSSGHLALAQMVIPGFRQPGVLFDAMLHVGTAMAVVWYERDHIGRWLRSPRGRRLLGLIGLGTVATALVAFPVRHIAEASFVRPLWVGACLVITGGIVAGTRALGGGAAGEDSTTWRQAVVIGLAQGIAVFPGLSRSGLTIAAGLGSGLHRAWVARFSFLLGVPAILAVAAVEVADRSGEVTSMSPVVWMSYALGTVMAAVSGYVALTVVVRTVSAEAFHRFGWYCVPLGLLVIVLSAGAV